MVGGAVRDDLLGRTALDVDVACRDPERAARALVALAGDAVFPLNEEFGAWRVLLDRSRTVDFSPLRGGSIDGDLAARDFTVNAIARPVDRRRVRRPVRRPRRRRARRPAGGLARRVRPRSAQAAARRPARGRAGLPARSAGGGADTGERRAADTGGGGADSRRVAAPECRRHRASRGARPAGAARRPHRPAPARLRLPVVQAGGHVRSEPRGVCRSRATCAGSSASCSGRNLRRTARRARSIGFATRPSRSRWRRWPTSGRPSWPTRWSRPAPTSRPSRCCEATSSASSPAQRWADCSS